MDEPVGSDTSAISASESAASDPRRLIDGIESHAIFELGTTGLIRSWPDSASALYGYNPDAVLGEHIQLLFADENAEGGSEPPVDFLDDARDSTVEIGHWHERADGTVFWGTLSLSPIWEDTFRGYAAVSRDTTQTRAYKQMLERQNDRLKEFTDILAHDLRTPLQVIDGRLQEYRSTGNDEHLSIIDSTTDRMERLVDDLLRVARQGNVVEDPEPTDIEDVIKTAWEGTGHPTAANLHYSEIQPVSADADRLCELFENLFRNAVEHGGADVTIRVGPLKNGIYIEDDGPGIPVELGESVFDHGVTTTETGSGYGLSVVRTILNAHGWDIVVTEGATGGARFEITGIDFLD